MADLRDEVVRVVSLNDNPISYCGMGHIGLLEQYQLYHHPSRERGYEKTPAKYLGFRYDGQLQSYHKVERWDEVDDLSAALNELTGREFKRSVLGWAHYFLYKLGPRLGPDRVIRSGQIRNLRYDIDMDLLLESETVKEAIAKTKARRSQS